MLYDIIFHLYITVVKKYFYKKMFKKLKNSISTITRKYFKKLCIGLRNEDSG